MFTIKLELRHNHESPQSSKPDLTRTWMLLKTKCRKYAFKSNEKTAQIIWYANIFNILAWDFCDNTKWLNARFANIYASERTTLHDELMGCDFAGEHRLGLKNSSHSRTLCDAKNIFSLGWHIIFLLRAVLRDLFLLSFD